MLGYSRSWGLSKARKEFDQGNYAAALEHIDRVIAKAHARGVQPGPLVLQLRADVARALDEQRRAAPVVDDHDSDDDDDDAGLVVVQGPAFPDPQEVPVYVPPGRKAAAAAVAAVPRATAEEAAAAAAAREDWALPVYGQPADEAAREREETRDEIARLRETVLYQRGPVGFENMAGENNCFLNVVLQSLFLLPPFATEFAAATRHTHDERCCVFCALAGIFAEYQVGERRAIPPTAMRRALSVLHAPASRIALHAPADASEALEGILGELHAELAGGGRAADAAPCTPPCLVHRVFGLELVQQDVCAACGARGRPLVAREWVLYSAVESVVVEHARCGSLARSIAHARAEPPVSCPARTPCPGHPAQRTVTLRACPAVLALGLVWPSSAPATATSRALVDALALTLDAGALFPHCAATAAAHYVLRGIVCFYGRHYILFFMDRDKHHPDPGAKRWWFFDDSVVRAVGPWCAVPSFIKQNSFHPTLLFYTKM